MDRAQAAAYIDRWQEVEEIERKEVQHATVQDRWRQLNNAKRRAIRLGIKRKGDDGEMEVFLLWAALRIQYAST